nr:MAG TPA: hypothetical protein [Caudoviricetes sp.]
MLLNKKLNVGISSRIILLLILLIKKENKND